MENRPDAGEVIVHYSSFRLFRSQVARKGLSFQKGTKQDSHNLGVLIGKGLADKELSDAGDPDVVPVVDFNCPQPVDKVFRTDAQVMFLDDRQYNLGLIVYLVLKSSKEHSKQIRVGITPIFLL